MEMVVNLQGHWVVDVVSWVGAVILCALIVFHIVYWYYTRFDEFGVDGGPVVKSLRPKFNVFSKHVKTHTGLELPYVEMKHLILGAIIMKGLLFIFGSSLGAGILFLHYLIAAPICMTSTTTMLAERVFPTIYQIQPSLALLGALLFFIVMKNSMPRRSPKKKAPKM